MSCSVCRENVAIYDLPRSITTRNQPQRSKRPVIEMEENRFDHFLKATDIFVDKSLLIKDILECNKTIVVISRPKHWGKSLNLDMLRKFVELEVDERGTPLLEENRVNHKLFTGGEIDYGYDERKPLRKLRIAEHPNLLRKFQGRFPVIHLDMSGLPAHDFVEIVEQLKDEIYDTYWEYLCGTLNRTDPLDHEQSEQLKYQCRQKVLAKLGVEHCLERLIETLFDHYKRKVYVLIDNYSDPVYEAREGYAHDLKCFQEISRLFADIYENAFRGNPCLEKAILTGIDRTIDLDLFPSTVTEQILYDTFFEQKFSQYYGFTREEVDELLKKVPTRSNPNQMKTRYLGYNYRERVLYNPLTVANYLAYDQIPHYDVENSDVFEQAEEILISGDVQTTLHSLLRRKSVILEDSTLPSGPLDQHNVYQFLANSGFLNPIPAAAPGVNRAYHLIIPNREEGQLYVVCVGTWIRDTFSKRDLFQYYDIIHVLVKGEVYRFKRKFLEYLSKSPLNSTTKNDYYNLIGGTASLLAWGYWYWKYGYTVWSDVDSSCKGCSYLLVPNIKTVHDAFVIGCKVLDTEHVVDSVAEDGLKRIGGAFVKEKLKVYRHVRRLIKIYVVFCKGSAAVEHEIIKVTDFCCS